MLPDIDSVLNNSTLNSWFGDIDLGEMFLNYFLDRRIRPYAGVDVTGLADLLQGKPSEEQKLLMRWERSLMGLKSSPYNCTHAFAWSEEFIRGNRFDPSNPFMWDKVVMNLPGQPDYNPSFSWVFHFDSIKNQKWPYFSVPMLMIAKAILQRLRAPVQLTLWMHLANVGTFLRLLEHGLEQWSSWRKEIVFMSLVHKKSGIRLVLL